MATMRGVGQRSQISEFRAVAKCGEVAEASIFCGARARFRSQIQSNPANDHVMFGGPVRLPNRSPLCDLIQPEVGDATIPIFLA